MKRRQFETDFLLWAVAAFGLWSAYLTYDHFTSAVGLVEHSLDFIDAVGAGKKIEDVPHKRRLWMPALKSVWAAVSLGWLAQRIAVKRDIRLSRRPDQSQAADYDDRRPAS